MGQIERDEAALSLSHLEEMIVSTYQLSSSQELVSVECRGIGLQEGVCRLPNEFAEMTLVLPVSYLLALERAAALEGMTTGQLVRTLINAALAHREMGPPGSSQPSHYGW